MERWFEHRTARHIKLVQRAGTSLFRFFADPEDLTLFKQRLKGHDRTKYGPQERVPYIFISWWYKHKDTPTPYEYPPGIEAWTHRASEHHVRMNLHHPEAHGADDRMQDVDLVDMVADWGGMSLELGTSLREWAAKDIPNYSFTTQQVQTIWDLVDMTGIK